jgi:CheY-like chemotaxis protein
MPYATPGKILIVDDEPQNVEVLRRLMTRLGYDVLTASDGDSALQSVISKSSGLRHFSRSTCRGLDD